MWKSRSVTANNFSKGRKSIPWESAVAVRHLGLKDVSANGDFAFALVCQLPLPTFFYLQTVKNTSEILVFSWLCLQDSPCLLGITPTSTTAPRPYSCSLTRPCSCSGLGTYSTGVSFTLGLENEYLWEHLIKRGCRYALLCLLPTWKQHLTLSRRG